MYTIKHSVKSPITTINPRKGQLRVVEYRKVKVLHISVGTSLGLRYGVIRLNGLKRIVVSRMQSNGQYSQWELISL